jgi:hypothetical protein
MFKWEEMHDENGELVGHWLYKTDNEGTRCCGYVYILDLSEPAFKANPMDNQNRAYFSDLEKAKTWLEEYNATSYTNWEDVPSHLRTRKFLKEHGLRPGRGQTPVARKTWVKGHKSGHYDLYDVNQAVPVKQKEKSDAKSS